LREFEALAESAAPRAVRAEAAYLGLQRAYYPAIQESSSPEVRRAFAARTDAWREKFSGEPREDEVRLLAADALWGLDDEAVADALRRAALSSNEKTARAAQTRRRAHELFRQPVNVSFRGLDGQSTELATLRGRVVLVHFWAAAFPQAFEELTLLRALHNTYRDRGLSLVGVSLDERRETAGGFARRARLPWPQHLGGAAVGADPNLAWGIDSLPSSWLIDKAGRMVPLRKPADLERQIAELLAR
jgi:hypothetical protein